MNKLASRFVKPEVIQIHKEENISFSSLPLSFSDPKDDINLGIGFLTRQQIQKLLNEGVITEAQVDVFYDGVRQFVFTTYKYFVKWLPLDDSFIKSCIFVDFERRNSLAFDDVQTVISSFTRIHSKLVEEPF